MAVRRRHREVDAEHELLAERHELRGRRIQRQHDLGLDPRHALDLGNGFDRRGGQEAPAGEAGPHAHPAPRDGDLAEHEAVAALDEAHDALAHRAERDEPGDADSDAEDGEQVPAQYPEQLHRGPTGSATSASLDGSASSRSWEYSRRTRGETTSGNDRGAKLCS